MPFLSHYYIQTLVSYSVTIGHTVMFE